MNKRLAKRVFVSLVVALSALPSFGNSIHSAKVNENCNSYNIILNFAGMTVGNSYTATWQINGLSQVINDQVAFKAKTPNVTLNITKTWASYGVALNGQYTLSGSVTLVGHNTMSITFNPAQQACPVLALACVRHTAQVGVAYSSNMAASGGAAPYTFALVGGSLPPGLTINTSTGAITGKPTTPGTYSFQIQVTDAIGETVKKTCSIVVTGTSPLSVSCQAVNMGDVGVPFNSGPMTVTGGTAPYTFSIVGTLPAGLTLNTSTGAVTGTPTAAGTFTVKVTDAAGNSNTGCSITINGSLSVTCSAVNSGTVGVPFNNGPMTVTGGTAPYTYSIIGTLPAGLTLNTSTGAVSGTPTASGTFTLKVTDALGNSSTSCNITINSPLSVTCSAINTGDVGVLFNSGPMTVTGGTAPYGYSIVGTLPPGLTLNSSTGAVTGTPTAAGTFTVKVTDASGNSSTGCAITINGPLLVTCAAVNTGEVGVPFNSGPMTVTGGTAPYTYSIVDTLPAGLTLNTSTGAVSGTPTAGGTFTVKVTDAVGNSSTSCEITINGPLSVICAAANVGEVSVPFDSGAMTVTGGVAPYSYSIVGTLPAGLTLNSSTGEVSGTPTAAGTFTVKVTDSLGNFSTSCNITITGPLAVLCGAVDTGVVGVAFDSRPMTVTGGVAPYSYSIVGTLPAGLTLNTSTGAVTGTPTAAGTFTVKVTDSLGTSSTSCQITINGPLSVTCAAVNTGEVGVQFNSGPMTVTGGVATYTYSIVGTLPAGLALDTTTGAVTGTPTASGSFTVEVTDGAGNSSTSCVITINGPLSVTCGSVNTGQVGVAFDSGPMTVTGGVAPYTYSIVGTLPAGLTLDTSTGDVSGTPTASGTFTVKVTDAMGNSSTSCAITLNGAHVVSSGDTATIGFWNNKNGQGVISAVNGGGTSTALGNWLATNFPYLYGPNSGNNLANMPNSAVAALFQTFFKAQGQNTQAQVMGVALAAYVTSTDLAGGDYSKFGFNVSSGGTGGHTYNVGSDGAAAGLQDNTSYSMLYVVQEANLQTQNGTFNATAYNSICSGINQTGDVH